MGDSLFRWRKFVCGALIIVLPAALMAEDSGAAMLRHRGGVLINHNPGPLSGALLTDDLVETQTGFEATLDAPGSTVTIKPETIVLFEGNELALDHGILLVSSSRQMAVRVGCLTTVPINAEWTQYDVISTDGKMTVTADKNDVEVQSKAASEQMKKTGRPERTIVREGEQKTFDEKCAAAAKPPTYVAAKGAILNSPYIKWPAAIGIGVLTCWVLCRNGDISPSNP
jgi:hypothetical protein